MWGSNFWNSRSRVWISHHRMCLPLALSNLLPPLLQGWSRSDTAPSSRNSIPQSAGYFCFSAETITNKVIRSKFFDWYSDKHSQQKVGKEQMNATKQKKKLKFVIKKINFRISKKNQRKRTTWALNLFAQKTLLQHIFCRFINKDQS